MLNNILRTVTNVRGAKFLVSLNIEKVLTLEAESAQWDEWAEQQMREFRMKQMREQNAWKEMTRITSTEADMSGQRHVEAEAELVAERARVYG